MALLNEEQTIDRTKPQFFSNPFATTACDIFNCSNRAKYFIGRPDGPLSLGMRVCEACAKAIVQSLPLGLQEIAADSAHTAAELQSPPAGVTADAMADVPPEKPKEKVSKPAPKATGNTQAYAEPAYPSEISEETKKEIAEAKAEGERNKHICPDCGKTFAKNAFLLSHRRMCRKAPREESKWWV